MELDSGALENGRNAIVVDGIIIVCCGKSTEDDRTCCVVDGD